MRAVIIDHAEATHLRFVDLPIPEPASHEALIAVRAISLNPGEIFGHAATAGGVVPGWETSGIVMRPAADGSGPVAGEHVAAFGESDGWAEVRAVPTAQLGILPPDLDLAAASTLPIAAASALRSIRMLGGVVGRRVLVVGATGAVGRFAVQLAVAAGADVIAVARDVSRREEIQQLGATAFHTSVNDLRDPVHHTIDTVGGGQLVEAFRLLRAHGTLVSVGRASREPIVFNADDFVSDQGRSDIRMRTFFLGADLIDYPEDIAWLAQRMADGQLTAEIKQRIPFGALIERVSEPLSGKTVVSVG